MALVDKLGQATSGDETSVIDDESRPPLSPWEKIFARPEWQKQRQSHNGQCSCCTGAVSLTETTCVTCGAIWRKPPKNKYAYLSYIIASLLISVAAGFYLKYIFELYIYRSYKDDITGKLMNIDFVNFMESYIWVSSAILVLLLSTYVFERLPIAPKETWISAEQSESTRH
jgi:hypothetical protein